MPKIIFVSNSLTAMHRFRRELIERFARSHEVVLISIANEDRQYLFENVKNVKNIYLGKNANLYHSINLLFVGVKLLFYICKNIRASDVIFSFSPTVNLMLGLLLRFKIGKPMWFPTFAGLGSISLMYIFPFYRLLFTKFSASWTNIFFHNSEHASMLRISDFIKLDGSGYEINLKKKPVKNKNIDFLFAGRLLSDKGIKEFCEAAKILHERDLKFTACIAGEIDLNHPRSIDPDIVENYKDYISFLGYQDNIDELLSKTRFSVLPSYTEGFSHFISMSLASGVPAISTLDGFQEIILQEPKIILPVQKRSVIDLVNKLDYALKMDQSEWLIRSEQCSKVAQKYLTKKNIIQKYTNEIYKNFPNL